MNFGSETASGGSGVRRMTVAISDSFLCGPVRAASRLRPGETGPGRGLTAAARATIELYPLEDDEERPGDGARRWPNGKNRTKKPEKTRKPSSVGTVSGPR